MATSIADLLDEISRAAGTPSPTPRVAADAANAIGSLGRAIDRMRVNYGNCDDASHQRLLAEACARLAVGTHRRPARLSDLAGAAADAVAVLDDEMSLPGGWAVTVAMADAIDNLTIAYVHGRRPLDLAAASRVNALHRVLTGLDRAAAERPPDAAAAAILRRPIPNLASLSTVLPGAIVDAVAGMLHYTRPGREIAVSELLAVSIAADSLLRSAAPPRRMSDRGRGTRLWPHVARTLRPFQDGSRRVHHIPSPLALHALNLHHAVTPTRRGDAAPLREVRYALHLLDDVAGNVISAVERWAATRALRAYAVDLGAGARYPAEFLAGRRPAGIVPAGRDDLLPTLRALHRARVGTARLAAAIEPSYARPDEPIGIAGADRVAPQRPL